MIPGRTSRASVVEGKARAPGPRGAPAAGQVRPESGHGGTTSSLSTIAITISISISTITSSSSHGSSTTSSTTSSLSNAISITITTSNSI